MNRRSFLKSLLLAPLALIAAKVLPKDEFVDVTEYVVTESGRTWNRTWSPSEINNASFGVDYTIVIPSGRKNSFYVTRNGVVKWLEWDEKRGQWTPYLTMP